MSENETKTLCELPRNTVNLIGSCQVITSVFSVVKELVENSLDADASSVDIKLENYGLDKVEVCDNGRGIKAADVPFMAKRHFTSKITCSEDLETLTTYGFRGEALGSLCAVSMMTITTKTAEDQLSYVYTIGPEGDIVDKKPSHVGKGTVVSAKNLFHNVPVRRQFYCGSKRKKDNLKKVEYILMAYAVLKPGLRLTLKHDKELIFQKTALQDIKSAMQSVLGRQTTNQMLHRESSVEELKLKVSAHLPKPGTDVKEMSTLSSEKTFVAVNDRPIYNSEINRVLMNYYGNCHALDIYRYPICFIFLGIATNHVDVNVDPNKTKVFFQHKSDILKVIEEILVEVYGPLDNVPSWRYADANGNAETSKGSGKTSRSIENPKRPIISYSKRPGEQTDDETGGEEPNKNQATKVPSFSLTFHEPSTSDEVQNDSRSQSNTVIPSGDEEVGLDKTVTDTANNTSSNLPLDEKSVEERQRDSGNVDKELPGQESTIPLVNEQCRMTETELGQLDTILAQDPDILSIDTLMFNDMETLAPSENRTADMIDGDKAGDVSSDKSSDDVLNNPLDSNSMGKNGTDVSIDPDAWSRGNVMASNTLLQPVKLLPPSRSHLPGKRPSSPSSHQPKRKAAKLSLPPNQTTLIEMMKSQQLKTPDSPFTRFSQDKHFSFAKEFPDEDEAAREGRLREAWNKLDEDEKVSYREMCWHDTKRYEKDTTSIKKGFEVTNSTTGEMKLMKKTTVEKLKKVLKRRLYGQQKTIKVPINELRNSSQESRVGVDDIMVIGPAYKGDDVWYCTLHEKLFIVNIWRLSEVVLYRKLKAEHKLPIASMDPVIVDSSVITEQGMAVLDTLARRCQSDTGTYFHVSDERLLSNGFKIKCHHDADGNLIHELVGICNVIPTYDVKDLNLVLGVLHSNADAALTETRTLKGTRFLQDEAVRMTRQTTRNKSSSDVYTLLVDAAWDTDQPCLHHKPIFKELVNLTDFHFDGD